MILLHFVIYMLASIVGIIVTGGLEVPLLFGVAEFFFYSIFEYANLKKRCNDIRKARN